MKNRRQINPPASPAFTLVEVLVTVAIIAVLAGIILPGLNEARNLARRGTCSSNIRELTRAIMIYSQDGAWHRGTTPNAMPSVGPTSANWHDLKNGNAGALWLLLTGRPPGYSGSPYMAKKSWINETVLLCPGASECGEPKMADGQLLPNTYSYSYLSMVPISGQTTLEVGPDLFVVADRNPRCTPGTAGIAPNTMQNSPNHTFKGQNIGRITGTALWIDRPDAAIVNDDIFSSCGGTDSEGKRGAVTDVFLIP